MAVRCICMVSACSICRDQPTALVSLVEERFVRRAVSLTVERLTRGHRDEEQGEEQEAGEELDVDRRADPRHRPHRGAQR